jgi:aminopeptidase N
MLGDAAFGTALHAYMDRWHGKHPIPWDFFNTFNDVTGRNLNWFWNAWYFSNNYIDLAVNSVTKAGNGYAVVLDNIGGMPAPVDLQASYADGTSETFHETPAIWGADQKRATVSIATGKTLKALTLNGGIWMDADTSNNSWGQK